MTTQFLKVSIAVLCLVELNAYRFPEEKVLERLYDLESMRGGQPLFEDDPRYDLLPQTEEQEHQLTIDDLLPYFPEADEEEEEGYNDRDQEPEFFRQNNLHIRDDGDVFLNEDPEIRSDDPRDPEQAQESALWGTHYVSGGAGEGTQHLKPNGEEMNKQEVKSDAALPAYCEPPNPCPKHYTEKDNCLMGVEDNASYNRKYILSQQRSGYCACDSEHMKHCPKDQPKINTKADKASDIQNMLSSKDFDGDTNKRGLRRVAKKSPRIIKRFKRFTAESMKNPYLAGEKIRTTAKKSPADEDWNKWYHLDQLQRNNDWAEE